MVGLAYDNAIFKTVRNAVIVQANQHGFTKAENVVIDELANIVCSYMLSLSNGAKQYSELAGRSTVNSFDVLAALKENGITLSNLSEYLRKSPTSKPIHHPKISAVSSDSSIKIGDERSMPSYIPGFLPRFPNPHTYCSTDITSDFETSYAKTRELQAQNKRNAENSLFGYALSTGYENMCLFRQLYETVKERAKSELDKQEAELQAKRARYNETATDMFEVKDTTNSIVRRTIPDCYFVLKPFPVPNPTMLALVGDENEDDQETQQAHPPESHIDDSKLTDGMDLSLEDQLMLSPDSPMSDDG